MTRLSRQFLFVDDEYGCAYYMRGKANLVASNYRNAKSQAARGVDALVVCQPNILNGLQLPDMIKECRHNKPLCLTAIHTRCDQSRCTPGQVDLTFASWETLLAIINPASLARRIKQKERQAQALVQSLAIDLLQWPPAEDLYTLDKQFEQVDQGAIPLGEVAGQPFKQQLIERALVRVARQPARVRGGHGAFIAQLFARYVECGGQTITIAELCQANGFDHVFGDQWGMDCSESILGSGHLR